MQGAPGEQTHFGGRRGVWRMGRWSSPPRPSAFWRGPRRG